MKMLLGCLEELFILHIPDGFGGRSLGPGCHIRDELSKAPLRIDLAQFFKRDRDPIGSGWRHNLSLTRGKCYSDRARLTYKPPESAESAPTCSVHPPAAP